MLSSWRPNKEVSGKKRLLKEVPESDTKDSWVSCASQFLDIYSWSYPVLDSKDSEVYEVALPLLWSRKTKIQNVLSSVKERSQTSAG
jgi:hypothetical protein